MDQTCLIIIWIIASDNLIKRKCIKYLTNKIIQIINHYRCKCIWIMRNPFFIFLQNLSKHQCDKETCSVPFCRLCTWIDPRGSLLLFPPGSPVELDICKLALPAAAFKEYRFVGEWGQPGMWASWVSSCVEEGWGGSPMLFSCDGKDLCGPMQHVGLIQCHARNVWSNKGTWLFCHGIAGTQIGFYTSKAYSTLFHV